MKIAFPALLALVFTACGSHDPKRTEAASVPPVDVQTVQVATVSWPVTYEAPGTVRARTSAILSSRLMGYIREIRVQPGDRVTAGQVLVTIDARDLDANLRQAQAAEAEARTAVAEADNGIAAAKAQLALAQATFKRMETLHNQTSISDQEFDETQARLRTAHAAFEMAQSKRTQIDARIAQAKQSVESAGIAQTFTRIQTPFAGIVTEKPAEPGQLAMPGMPLLTIEQAGGYRLEAPVEESLLGSIRVGQHVKVALDAYGQTLDARVDEVVPAIDAQSRAFVVKASLPSAPNLRSGLFGKLLIERSARQSPVVPADAIARYGELRSVFVADNGVARTRMVAIGSTREGAVEILSGLVPGERVIRPRPANLVDGMKVAVR
jgi:multidrug efflux pump subunit AcrA (membrane-fusion protein)